MGSGCVYLALLAPGTQQVLHSPGEPSLASRRGHGKDQWEEFWRQCVVENQGLVNEPQPRVPGGPSQNSEQPWLRRQEQKLQVQLRSWGSRRARRGGAMWLGGRSGPPGDSEH